MLQDLPDLISFKKIKIQTDNLDSLGESLSKVLNNERKALNDILKAIYVSQLVASCEQWTGIYIVCRILKEKHNIDIDYQTLLKDSKEIAKRISENAQIDILANSKNSNIAQQINEIFKNKS